MNAQRKQHITAFVLLAIGAALIALGVLSWMQLFWEGAILLWLGTGNLLSRRKGALISLFLIPVVLYTTVFPDIPILAPWLGWLVNIIWGGFLFLCIRFLEMGPARDRLSMLLAFPLVYSFRLIDPMFDFYANLILQVLGMLLLIEGAVRAIIVLWRGDGEILPHSTARVFFRHGSPIHSLLEELKTVLGVDLRSLYVFSFVRKALLPLTVLMGVSFWLLSCLVLIAPYEKGVRFQFGVPQKEVLEPGFQFKLPWPMGEIRRAPALRIISMKIGHEEEEEEEGEEESILWANQHAEEEYSLLMGDQVNLVSVDGVLQYRIFDVHLYLLQHQNADQQLQDMAHRALSRQCAQRSLTQVLSENVQSLSAELIEEITPQAKALGLEPISFTFSALHPPVAVARDYQAVVSAQILKEERIIRAQEYELKSIPKAESKAYRSEADAIRIAENRLAEARGEAAMFNGLYQSVYQNKPLYLFQRRLEVLEENLKGRRLVIVDHRFEEAGAELWIKD